MSRKDVLLFFFVLSDWCGKNTFSRGVHANGKAKRSPFPLSNLSKASNPLIVFLELAYELQACCAGQFVIMRLQSS